MWFQVSYALGPLAIVRFIKFVAGCALCRSRGAVGAVSHRCGSDVQGFFLGAAGRGVLVTLFALSRWIRALRYFVVFGLKALAELHCPVVYLTARFDSRWLFCHSILTSEL